MYIILVWLHVCTAYMSSFQPVGNQDLHGWGPLRNQSFCNFSCSWYTYTSPFLPFTYILGSVSIVRRFDSPKIQLKLKLALTLTLTLTDTGDLRTVEPSDYRADTIF